MCELFYVVLIQILVFRLSMDLIGNACRASRAHRLDQYSVATFEDITITSVFVWHLALTFLTPVHLN